MMTTLKKLNLVMLVAILLVFSSATMAWNWTETWEELKQDIKEGSEELEAGVKKGCDKLEKGVKNGIDKLEKGLKKGGEKLEKGIKKGIEELDNGIENLQRKLPEWKQDLEDGLEKGSNKIRKLLRKLDPNLDTSGQGCGTGLTTQIVIDNWNLFDFSSACQAHDNCYSTCNTTRNACDNDFLTLLQKTCPSKKAARVKYQLCRAIAKVYWYTVSETGQSAWEKAQTNCH
jgi:hypothetical protein